MLLQRLLLQTAENAVMTKPATRKHGQKQLLLSTLLGAVLTVLFAFLGAPVLRVLGRVGGTKWFWISAVIATLLVWPLSPIMSLIALSMWFTIGLYGEIEERGKASVWMAGIAVLVGSAIGFLGPWAYTASLGIDLPKLLESELAQWIRNATGGSATQMMGVELKLLIQLLPSLVVLMNLMALAFALILDRRSAQLLNLRFEKVASQIKLLEFRVPESLIWVTMASFLFSFLKLENELVTIVAANVFNVMMGLYFFQGLAVLEVVMLVFRVGPFMKFLVYFIIVGQLFLMLSVLGILDYWADFRKRFKKVMRSKGQTRNGENV